MINYFGLAPTQSNSANSRVQITRLFEQCRTEVIFIEQFNAFQGSSSGALSISEQIKFLSEATDGLALVIVGIDLEYESLRANPRSHAVVSQFFDRLSVETITHPDLSTNDGHREYLQLLATWEHRLPLLNMQAGDIARHSHWLADNTDGGKTARLATLIRLSAKQAILDGSEKISLEHLQRAAPNVSKAQPLLPSAAHNLNRSRTRSKAVRAI